MHCADGSCTCACSSRPRSTSRKRTSISCSRPARAQRLVELLSVLEQLLGDTRRAALLREGLRVVLAGQPNVGKSSLLNALAGAELAIVTPIAGTTRDRIAETIQIDGVPLHVTDTAGLRADGSDEIERIGIQRSWQSIADADAVLFLHDLTRLGDAAYDAAERDIAAQLPAAAHVLHVFTKRDLAGPAPHAGIELSTVTGTGLAVLREELLRRAGWQGGAEGLFIARTRHLQALQQAREHLLLAQAQLDTHTLELLAEELRLAHDALAQITGAFTPDQLLGEIFSRFCIGK